MRLTAWIRLRAIDLIAKPRDRATANVVNWRAGDDGSAVISFVTDSDYF
jgi:hypothetical protein